MGNVWLLLLFPAFAFGQSTNPVSKTNQIAPPKYVELSIPAMGNASAEAARAGYRGSVNLKAVVALPAGFDARRAWPVLLVTAPSGSSAVGSVRSYTNIALADGWVVTAIDGPKVSAEQDNNVFAWAMISSLLGQLRTSWPQSKQWPFACAGFSGGAKRAAMVAAEMTRQGDRVIGVFMGGCNEDRATLGYRISHPGDAFLDVPMFLSNGGGDPIAGPQQGTAVKQSMVQTGFRRIRLETYEGQHRLDTNQFRLALQWFRPTAK